MMAANLVVLLPFLLSSSILSNCSVDSSLYLLNLFDTFLQLFVMMIQNRHDDRMKWYKLTGIGASRDVEFRSIKHIVKILFFFLIQSIAKWLPFLFFHCKRNLKGTYCSAHLTYDKTFLMRVDDYIICT